MLVQVKIVLIGQNLIQPLKWFPSIQVMESAAVLTQHFKVLFKPKPPTVQISGSLQETQMINVYVVLLGLKLWQSVRDLGQDSVQHKRISMIVLALRNVASMIIKFGLNMEKISQVLNQAISQHLIHL